MLLWTLHPRYLDNKGLGGLWFETLIARNTLLGLSGAYQNHPQLQRFKIQFHPIDAINTYLLPIYMEGVTRGFHYNRSLFDANWESIRMETTAEQLKNEYERLLLKLKHRDLKQYHLIQDLHFIEPHPMFDVL